MSVKRIGVLTSGGDAPGMNPCVRAVVRTALYRGLECYGIRRGWNGLITGDIVRLDEKSVSHTINRGGTILYTARSQEFMTEEGQRRAVSTCKFLGLDSIIAIGGDGTFRGALELSRMGIPVGAEQVRHQRHRHSRHHRQRYLLHQLLHWLRHRRQHRH